jgi:hypothetical protein
MQLVLKPTAICFLLMISEQKDEECDATEDEQGTEAGLQKRN